MLGQYLGCNLIHLRIGNIGSHHFLVKVLDLSPFSSPSQADWLNERSSTPPVSVINAAVVVSDELLPPDESVEPLLPHAPKNNPAASATAPKPNNFAFSFL